MEVNEILKKDIVESGILREAEVIKKESVILYVPSHSNEPVQPQPVHSDAYKRLSHRARAIISCLAGPFMELFVFTGSHKKIAPLFEELYPLLIRRDQLADEVRASL